MKFKKHRLKFLANRRIPQLRGFLFYKEVTYQYNKNSFFCINQDKAE